MADSAAVHLPKAQLKANLVVAALILCSAHLCAAESIGAAAADPVEWRHLALDRALTDAALIKDPYRRAEVLTGVSKSQALIDDSGRADRTLRAALAAAAEISEPTFQGWILHEIVLAQIAARDMIGALQTAQRIRSERPQGAALAAIAMVQLRGGNLAAAQATAARIKDEDAAGEVLRQIAAMQTANGARSAARETARRIDDGYYQALACGDVAVADVRAGDLTRANAMASVARRAHRAQVYERIALARADAGDLKGALETAGSIDGEMDRALVQGRIAARLATAGDRPQAEQLFATATEGLARAPDKKSRKAVAWSQLARMKALAGDEVGAGHALSRAMVASNDISPGPGRDEAYDSIARSRIRINQSDGAFATAALIEDRVTQALLIRDIVAAQADLDGAEALLRNPAVNKDSLTQTAALFGVIGVQLLRKDRARANPEVVAATIGAARTVVRSIADLQIRPAALAALAAAGATIGEIDTGRDIFDEALQAAAALELPEQRAAAYVRIVSALDERLLFLGQPASSS